MFGLWQQYVPKIQREGLVCSTYDGNIMIFESLNGFLHQVAPMIMWGNKLERHLVQVDSVLEVLRAFVVQDVEFLGQCWWF
jgi:hypothetical protein